MESHTKGKRNSVYILSIEFALHCRFLNLLSLALSSRRGDEGADNEVR
jgi:hypothetical protein